jgi:hypothetical protein
VEEEAKTAKRYTSVEAGNILRYRGENKVDMKEFETSYQAGQTGSSLRFRETAPVRRTQDFESAKVIEATEAPPAREFKRTAEFSSAGLKSSCESEYVDRDDMEKILKRGLESRKVD